MGLLKPKRKPHVERGWAVLVKWKGTKAPVIGYEKLDAEWSLNGEKDDSAFIASVGVKDNTTYATILKCRDKWACLCNIESAKIVPVEIRELQRKRKAKK